MKAKTKSEWENCYKEKTGCEDLDLHPDEKIFFQPDYGFVSFLTYGDILEVHHMCGDGKYWARVLKNVMRFENLKKIRAFTGRNPKAWARKYGGQCVQPKLHERVSDSFGRLQQRIKQLAK